MRETITPRHDNLRRAVRWLAERRPITPAAVEAASVRFDLSAQDEQFLLNHFLADADPGDPSA